MEKNHYLVAWVVEDTLNFGAETVSVPDKMTWYEYREVQENLRKKHKQKKLKVLSFSKFEGEGRTKVIDIKS